MNTVTPITAVAITPEGQVREYVSDIDTPMVDAIDKAMQYAIDEALGPEFAATAGDVAYRLHGLVTLAARGAVFRGLREERERVAADSLSTPPTHPISQNAFIREVIKFNMIAGRTMDEFNPRTIALHTALQLEELGEKLELGLLARPFTMNCDALHLANTVIAMKTLGLLMKSGALDLLFEKGDPVELLDGDIDVMVVSIGSMMSQGADIFGACHAVSGANLAKFPGGVCIKDKDGKIQKPDGWAPADLKPFLHISKRFIEGDLGVPAADEAEDLRRVSDSMRERFEAATVTGLDGVERPNPAAGAPKPENWNPVA